MRRWLPVLLLASLCGTALANEPAPRVPPATAEFEIIAPRTLLIAPPLVAPNDSLFEAKIEPTKHELRFDNVLAAERWEQNFEFSARLPVAEAFSLRQEFRAGMQNETVLGHELSTVFRDALTTLEKTSAELRTSEALRIVASVQEQWIVNNSVPFAEIVTYGAEVKFSPVKATTVKLQLEWGEREEFAATQSEQENYRLALEQELVPKRLAVAMGASRSHANDLGFRDRESFTSRLDGSVKWTPVAATSLTIGGERSERATVALAEDSEAYAVKLQQQLFAGSKLELQAGYELHTRSPLEAGPLTGSAWNLGANSDFAVREDWNAGVGIRYRLREEVASPAPDEELSLTLSVKGRF